MDVVDHPRLMALIIGYSCVGVFVATALITVLSLANLIAIPASTRNKLYATLLFEVIAISLAAYGNLLSLNPKPVAETIDTLQATTRELAQKRGEQVAPPTPQPSRRSIAEVLASGETCFVRFPPAPEDDTLGSIARGPVYTLKYEASTARYWSTGYNAGRGGRTSTAAYPGPPPAENRFVIWGAPFSFDSNGAVKSDGNTSKGRRLDGQLTCPS